MARSLLVVSVVLAVGTVVASVPGVPAAGGGAADRITLRFDGAGDVAVVYGDREATRRRRNPTVESEVFWPSLREAWERAIEEAGDAGIPLRDLQVELEATPDAIWRDVVNALGFLLNPDVDGPDPPRPEIYRIVARDGSVGPLTFRVPVFTLDGSRLRAANPSDVARTHATVAVRRMSVGSDEQRTELGLLSTPLMMPRPRGFLAVIAIARGGLTWRTAHVLPAPEALPTLLDTLRAIRRDPSGGPPRSIGLSVFIREVRRGTTPIRFDEVLPWLDAVASVDPTWVAFAHEEVLPDG